MFALIAALVFFLALIDVGLGDVDMLVLGLFFVAVHLAFSWTPWGTWPNRNP